MPQLDSPLLSPSHQHPSSTRPPLPRRRHVKLALLVLIPATLFLLHIASSPPPPTRRISTNASPDPPGQGQGQGQAGEIDIDTDPSEGEGAGEGWRHRAAAWRASLHSAAAAAAGSPAAWWAAHSGKGDKEKGVLVDGAYMSADEDPLMGVAQGRYEGVEMGGGDEEAEAEAEGMEEGQGGTEVGRGKGGHMVPPEWSYDWPGGWGGEEMKQDEEKHEDTQEQEKEQEQQEQAKEEHRPDDLTQPSEPKPNPEQHLDSPTETSDDADANADSPAPSPASTAPPTSYSYTVTLPADLPAHTPAADQPRIVILQHVFASDDVSRRLFALSEAAYRTYAGFWGYTYVRDTGVYMPDEYEARRKGMNKLYPVLRVMIEELGKQGDEGGAEWMLMTDADTLPINPAIPLHSLLPPSSAKHIWFLGNEDWNGFNAGNMLLRISRSTVAFLSEVIAREVDMSRFEGQGKYPSPPPSDQEALCLELESPEWRDHFYAIPMKWINAYCSPFEKGQDDGGPVTLPWTDGGEQEPGVWTPQLNFHLVFILKHYREIESLMGQMEAVWMRMRDEGWRGERGAKAGFAAGRWWDQKVAEGMGAPPRCSGF